MSSLHSEAFWKFQAQYKFSISFENGECNDYITEKLWRPLVIGSVPIYYGAENFKVLFSRTFDEKNCTKLIFRTGFPLKVLLSMHGNLFLQRLLLTTS
jgi:Glycosyltransferase family 10 (fucosyltransferase) C-term